jgi:hypothetical protein
MKKCLLCERNDADKTGSHIIPHFLSKRIDNQEGEKGRDKELGFNIDPFDSKMYFGRAILPEKIEEIYGEVDEELLKQNNNENIVDNIFCTECERRLSVIENEYSKTLGVFNENESNFQSTNIPFLGFLFWSSVFWRLAIMPNSGYKMKDKEQKKLKRILDKYLNLDIQSIKLNVADFDLLDIGYKVIRSPNFSENFPTYQHSQPFFDMPYSIMVDEYLIFFYFKKSYLKGIIQDMYGSHELLVKTTFNTPFNPEIVLSVSHERFKDVISKMLSFFVEKKMNNLHTKLDLFHQRMFPGMGMKMNPLLKKKILENLGKDNEKLGKKNRENEIKIIERTIIDFYNVKG